MLSWNWHLYLLQGAPNVFSLKNSLMSEQMVALWVIVPRDGFTRKSRPFVIRAYSRILEIPKCIVDSRLAILQFVSYPPFGIAFLLKNHYLIPLNFRERRFFTNYNGISEKKTRTGRSIVMSVSELQSACDSPAGGWCNHQPFRCNQGGQKGKRLISKDDSPLLYTFMSERLVRPGNQSVVSEIYSLLLK